VLNVVVVATAVTDRASRPLIRHAVFVEFGGCIAAPWEVQMAQLLVSVSTVPRAPKRTVTTRSAASTQIAS
jgi:hypothetical protein